MVLFLSVVVLAECVIAYFYLPTAAETAVLAGTAVAAEPAEPAVKPLSLDTEESEKHSADQVEVDLEQFSVTSFQPVSNTTLRIDFHLFGAVASKDEVEFQQHMAKNVHRFREQVIVIVRGAAPTRRRR